MAVPERELGRVPQWRGAREAHSQSHTARAADGQSGSVPGAQPQSKRATEVQRQRRSRRRHGGEAGAMVETRIGVGVLKSPPAPCRFLA